jgi:hypothetical protein
VPTANITYDLGATGRRFRDIYLSGNTIHLGTSQISIVDGALSVNSTPVKTTFVYLVGATYEANTEIIITPPTGAVAGRLTISGGGGAGGSGNNKNLTQGGGAGGCSIHMIPVIGATAHTLILGAGGNPTELLEAEVYGGFVYTGGGGEGGGASSYSFIINTVTTTINVGGGGGGAAMQNSTSGDGSSGNGSGGNGGNGGVYSGADAQPGTTISPFSFIDYNTGALGDGGIPNKYDGGKINPLGGYGGDGYQSTNLVATAGAPGFAIIEWLF